jgi:predicted ArsR family transcriptional regulator
MGRRATFDHDLAIVLVREGGWTTRQVADEFGVTTEAVRRILRLQEAGAATGGEQARSNSGAGKDDHA